jgi:hypothetical protein
VEKGKKASVLHICCLPYHHHLYEEELGELSFPSSLLLHAAAASTIILSSLWCMLLTRYGLPPFH